MANTEENKAKAKAFLVAMGVSDLPTMMNLLSDDLEYWVAGSLPLSGTHTKAALKEMVGPMKQYFPEGLIVNPVGETAEGNRVAIEAKGGGTTVTGKKYNNHYHFLFEFDAAGKIDKLREYMDTGHAADIFAG